MTVQEAIEILRDTPIDIRSTREDDIHTLYATAQGMAIEALSCLEKPNRSDLIRRQDAINKFEPWLKVEGYSEGELNMLKAILYELTVMPSTQPEPCGDVVSRNAIVQKLNEMDRYVSAELRLCDTDKKFPQNEVFIVDDVYEEIVEQLPSAQQEQPPYVAEIEAEYQKAVKMPHIHKPLAKALYEVWKKHDREDAERRADE